VAGWRQGFISNVTNPKVLVFYLAVLPQFLTPGAGLGWLLVLAWSHAILSLTYLMVLITGLHGARRLLMRRKVRRALDTTTGVVLLGFGARLATEHV
jgi:threonine/homoserine/homoserine lactone efflux protein